MLGEGIQEGDRVPAVISNSVDAIVICLAALSIGALYSSASPDLGSQAIVDRFVQIKPKLIFADNGFVYAGKLHNVGAVLNVDLYEWFYKTAFPCQVQLVSMSGGTDISGACKDVHTTHTLGYKALTALCSRLGHSDVTGLRGRDPGEMSRYGNRCL
jgi:acyl-coenzyme A synthetase/AMP-(fatty) acid ligase